MNPDPLANKLKSIAKKCDKCESLFESFKQRAKEIHADGSVLPDGSAFVDDEGPGFGIYFPWKRLRFVWELINVDRSIGGQLVVLESRLDDELEDSWKRALELPFDMAGRIDPSRLPDDANGLAIGDATDNYYLFMHCVIQGILGKLTAPG
jgi:hypothetical protein